MWNNRRSASRLRADTMNDMAFRHFTEMPAPAPLPLPKHVEALCLGMPQLSACGLSEKWLLEELGHRHWMMLAEAAGMDLPDFRDEEGRPVYAAFCAVRLKDARLELGRETGRLAICSSMRRVSRTQIASRHEIIVDERPGGVVEMVSVFVKRTDTSNHSIARVVLTELMSVEIVPSEIAALAAAMRTRRLSSHLGFDLVDSVAEIAACEFEPCPAQDFNGAGFLYFSSFLAFVDRAEWQLDRSRAPLSMREAFYYGNIDPGEAIRVVLVSEQPITGMRRWRIERTGQRTLLADVFTQRERTPAEIRLSR